MKCPALSHSRKVGVEHGRGCGVLPLSHSKELGWGMEGVEMSCPSLILERWGWSMEGGEVFCPSPTLER